MSEKLTKLSTLIDEISMGPFGSDIKVENFVSSGVPVLNGSNLEGFKITEEEFRYVTPEKAKSFKKAIAKRGDIVITHRGTLGQISYVPSDSNHDEYVISQSQFRVRLKADLADPAFVVYYFHTNEGQKRLLANKCHVGVPALASATTNFRLIEIPLPALSTQQEIAAVLSALDAKIDLNNRINAELEAIAKTLYDYWFVQFDFPDANGKPYKSSGGKMTWNPELKREIPDGWEVQAIGDLVRCNYKSITKKDKYQFINYLDTSNLTENIVETIETIDLSKEIRPQRAQRIVSKNDILYSTVRPNQHHFGIIKEPVENLVASTGFAQLASKTESIKSELIYLFLTSDSTIRRLQQIADGAVSSYPSISPDDLLALNIALPKDKAILKGFNSTTTVSSEQMWLNQQQNQHLSAFRDWLLPMLMNGQVTVKG